MFSIGTLETCAIAPRGRPTSDFLAFCGELSLGRVILDAGDCQ